MHPHLDKRLRASHFLTALFLAVAVLAKDLKCDTVGEQTKAELKFDPFHLSWTSNNTRFDFVFSIHKIISNLVKLETDPTNYLSNSLKNCTNQRGCLFKNATFLESFQIGNETSEITHETHFKSTGSDPVTRKHAANLDACDTGNSFKIIHYCSTHWNPPLYNGNYRLNCAHTIEWHSPLSCHLDATNHERPCYVYEPSGKLIDLTSWILSEGTSYKIDTSNTTVKQFNINICNEAHEPCGPNVAACFVDGQSNIVEGGYNNLTSIKYNANVKTVLLTSLGQYKQNCDGSRVRTVVHFICKNKVFHESKPRLVRSTACESIIEWPSVHACPVSDISIPERDCKFKYEPLGIDIDIKQLTNNKTLVEVPNMKLNGQTKKMIFGICQPVPKNFTCEGKLNSHTKACLVDSNKISSGSVNNSLIVGSVLSSQIRLSDDKIYLESRAMNRTCAESVRENFNVTQQVGTRIEFFCSPMQQEKPAFLGYDDCTYVFEWGSPKMCFEKLVPHPAFAGTNQTKAPEKDTTQSSVKPKEMSKKENATTDTMPVPETQPSRPVQINKRPKTNGRHAFFMISIIVMLFAAFILVIFILDKKTRLKIRLRQTSNLPYSRVNDDLDL